MRYRLSFYIESYADRAITFIVSPFLRSSYKRKIARHDGVLAHMKLNRRFRQIDKDPFVKTSREYYASHPTRYARE